LGTFVGWILISGYGISIGFHRYFSHRSFKTSRWISRLLAFLGCLGGQGSPLFWAALHRGLHHPFSDTDKDIHSPTKGWWMAYLGWQIHFNPMQLPIRSALDLQKDSYLMFLHKKYYFVVWVTGLVLCLVDPRLFLSVLILPMFISIHTENMVNLFCHLPSLGYKNFELKDNSRNIWWLGLGGFGQGWHNNHHADPSRYNYGGQRWFEFDPSVPLIGIIKCSD